MRFFWKATPDSRDHRGLKCKILRAVTFPDVLDIYDFCTEELQSKLKVNRVALDNRVTAKFALSSTATADVAAAVGVSGSSGGSESEGKMDVVDATTTAGVCAGV